MRKQAHNLLQSGKAGSVEVVEYLILDTGAVGCLLADTTKQKDTCIPAAATIIRFIMSTTSFLKNWNMIILMPSLSVVNINNVPNPFFPKAFLLDGAEMVILLRKLPGTGGDIH